MYGGVLRYQHAAYNGISACFGRLGGPTCQQEPQPQNGNDIVSACPSSACCSISSFSAAAGYTGFVPESKGNHRACHQASAMEQPREDSLAKSMLYTLDQYSRQRVPLYTGHRATALSNLPADAKAHQPTTRTTQVSLCQACHHYIQNTVRLKCV